MLTLNIKHSDGVRELNISAETMKELIDIKLPSWVSKLKEDLPSIKKTKRYKANPKKVLKEERESGWYYDC